MHDLISFLGVLATAIMLVCVGHVAPANIAVVAAGLGALFAAWRNHGAMVIVATTIPEFG